MEANILKIMAELRGALDQANAEIARLRAALDERGDGKGAS